MSLSEKLNRYQKILSRNKPLYNAAQECLQAWPELDDRDKLFLLVFAPVAVSFTAWVIEQALNQGRKRLYFLARDAFFMHTAAEMICAAEKLPLDCRYLQVSRYAVRQAQYHLIGERSLDFLCTNGIDTTFEKVMKRAGMMPEEAKQIACETGRWEGRRKVLTYPQLQELKQELKKSHFLQLIEARSREAYPNVLGYLRQEGLLDDTPFALVDSGWIGTLQQSLEELIRSEKKDAPLLTGYYFGLYEIPEGMKAEQYKTFYFSPHGQFWRKVHFANSLFETIFSSPEGMTVGYRQSDKKFEPVISEKGNPNADFLERCKVLLDNYISVWQRLTQNKRVHDTIDTKLCEDLLRTFMCHPAPEEVELYGNLLFCDDVLEMQMQKAAAELSEEEIKRQSLFRKALILSGIRKEEIHESAWIEGSIVRNGSHVTRYLRQTAIYKRFVYMKKSMKRV